MSRTHSFPITKTDQVGSRQKDCTLCPAARSLRSHGYPEAVVTHDLTYLSPVDPEDDNDQVTCTNTDGARQWLQRHDQGTSEDMLPAVITVTQVMGETRGQLDIAGPGQASPQPPSTERPAPKIKFQWHGPVMSRDPWGRELRHHSLECSNGASATLTREPGRGAPVYLADLKNPDDTRLTSVYIHTNLPDARREVEERIIRAA